MFTDPCMHLRSAKLSSSNKNTHLPSFSQSNDTAKNQLSGLFDFILYSLYRQLLVEKVRNICWTLRGDTYQPF